MAVDEMKRMIELSGVGMRYDNRTILRDVNLTVNKGDFIAITGPNGGGKTTFLRIVLRLLKPTSGTVTYLVDDDSDDLRIGYLPQKNMIDSRFPITVHDVVELGLYGKKNFSDCRREEMISDVLEKVGMQDRASSGIGDLSGGQLQRTLLARAIVADPQLLVLDEPLSYVDRKFEHRMYDLISEIASRTTILLVSHEMTTIASMANRHIIVDHELHFCHSAHHFIHYDCCENH